MDRRSAARAVDACTSTASSLGLDVSRTDVLHNSNRLAVRLLPCDVLARVAPSAHEGGAGYELEVAVRLADTNTPIELLDPRVAPRVHSRDDFAITFWTYYPRVPPVLIAPDEYARALAALHAGMRQVDVTESWLETADGQRLPPHFTDRVDDAERLLLNHARTPELTHEDRQLLLESLRDMRRAIVGRGVDEQLLHGEPHTGNVLRTRRGLLFVDLETCCRGPVEFDIAHAVSVGTGGVSSPPEEVSRHYPEVNRDLLIECWTLMLAMITTWRWDAHDQFPDGRALGRQWLSQLRAVRSHKR